MQIGQHDLRGAGFYKPHVPGDLYLWVSFQETAGLVSALLTMSLPTHRTVATMGGSLMPVLGW